jgi:two-component system response regulator TctD
MYAGGTRPGGAAGGPAERAAGSLRLDARTRTLAAGDREARLTVTEFAVLGALMDQAGRVVSRRRLLAAAGHDQAGDRAADVYIAQLRAKIGPGAAIRTVRGAGYTIDL